ncbi:TetR/AcrR family transcriptional regulator [Pacificimonas sp. ICDLI1SI03]
MSDVKLSVSNDKAVEAGLFNKNGQVLGRKGLQTQQRLMRAAHRLIAKHSPFNLSIAQVSKEANVGKATFYVYFNDVQDLIFALCAQITEEIEDLFSGNDSLLREGGYLHRDALILVKEFNRVWDRHSEILLYRNIEADRGNPRFNDLRTQSAIPILDALCDRIATSFPRERAPRRVSNYAEAIVFFVAMERLAAAAHQYPSVGLDPGLLIEAQASVLVRLLEPREIGADDASSA